MDPRIAKVLQGDLAAYQPLVQEHQRAVWRVLSVLLYDPAKTQKLVESVFADALFSLTRAEQAGGFEPHVLSVARRRVATDVKHALEHTDQLKAFRERLAERFDDDATAKRWLDRAHAALGHCSGQLPDKAASIAEARWHRGLDVPAIAKALGRPESVVRHKLNRVRLALYPCVNKSLGA